jgi:hypothetical protein
MQYLITTILLLTIFSTVLTDNSPLIFVQELFRHGARYPIFPSTIDKSDYAIKEKKVG